MVQRARGSRVRLTARMGAAEILGAALSLERGTSVAGSSAGQEREYGRGSASTSARGSGLSSSSFGGSYGARICRGGIGPSSHIGRQSSYCTGTLDGGQNSVSQRRVRHGARVRGREPGVIRRGK